MADIINNPSLLSKNLYSQISQILKEARTKVATTVNTAMVQAYWHIGKLIVDAQGVLQLMKLFKLIYEFKYPTRSVKKKILFINLPPSFRHFLPLSSVMMPASFLLQETKPARKPDEILIKK
ncbi:MAG: hypothetical protein K2L22_08550 [Muribaculaceae bacterium]|nr:hypothetical protein [Muribaculaceae bacterium]